MVNQWRQLVPENIEYKASHLKNNLNTIACTKLANKNKLTCIIIALKSQRKVEPYFE